MPPPVHRAWGALGSPKGQGPGPRGRAGGEQAGGSEVAEDLALPFQSICGARLLTRGFASPWPQLLWGSGEGRFLKRVSGFHVLPS